MPTHEMRGRQTQLSSALAAVEIHVHKLVCCAPKNEFRNPEIMSGRPFLA